MGRKNVLPLILCSEKKNSYIIVGISPLGTTRGAGDLSEEDQVRVHYICQSVILSICYSILYSSLLQGIWIIPKRIILLQCVSLVNV